MYRKEVNEKSPMRVFEKSMHGGLGAGNVGVVISRPGVGKTALLVQVALDDLMRGKRVLHISHETAVDHVRAYYDELFHDLANDYQLDQPDRVRLDVERNRLLCSHLEKVQDNPPSLRGGRSSIDRIEQTVRFATDTVSFQPDIVIVEGFDFAHATTEAVDALGELAKEVGAELWLSARTDEYVDAGGSGPESTPAPLRRFFDHVAVIVLLRPEEDSVRLELLKEHDNPDVSELSLRLEPTTMRVVDEDVPPRSNVPRNPRQFQLFSGGARGAEAAFGACAEAWQVRETHFSFEGHEYLARERGLVVLDEGELKKGDFSLVYASRRLGRPLAEIPHIRRILQTVWHQITAADEVFVIGALQDDGTVKGGTGWGAELARLWHKPLCLFDQAQQKWQRWDGSAWVDESAPVIKRKRFAGIGTTQLSEEGNKAVRGLFERSFGPAPN
jgi:archaellum biogenesis ATPase FlaH